MGVLLFIILEILRYILVFIIVGIGTAVLGTVLSIFTMPPRSRLRGTVLGGVVFAASNSLAAISAVVAAVYVCSWTGDDASYAMFALALWPMHTTAYWRRLTAQTDEFQASQLDEADRDLRIGAHFTEGEGFLGDLVGFACGLVIVSPLSFI